MSPFTPYKILLSFFNQLKVPGCPQKTEQLFFSILELLNNSFRAHINGGNHRKISLVMFIRNKDLHFIISDWGGGFNPEKLPYNIQNPEDNIDFNSPRFVEYREKNQYKRFGMGLYVSWRIFDDFRLSFIDGEGKETSWKSGKTAGTYIELTLRGGNENE